MSELGQLLGIVLLLWAASRLLGALVRAVEAVVLVAVASWLLLGRLPVGRADLEELARRVVALLGQLVNWWAATWRW